MRRVLFLTITLILTAQIACAQNAIAKLVFEEAEEAYDKENYELALSKINETEGLLKSTNPRILYLRILTQGRLIMQDRLKDYGMIESTRELADKYLREYGELPDNEEKFRDIYRISQSIKANLPATRAEFDALVSKKNAEEQARADEASLKLKKNQDYILAVAQRYHFKPGMLVSQLPAMDPIYHKVPKAKGHWYTNSKEVKVFSRGNPNGCGGEIISDEYDIVVMLTIRPCVKRAGKQLEELNEFQAAIMQNIDPEYIEKVVKDDFSYGNITNLIIKVPGTNMQIESHINGSSFQLDFDYL